MEEFNYLIEKDNILNEREENRVNSKPDYVNVV